MIAGQYYADVLIRFDLELTKRRPQLLKKRVLFHHDNGPFHSSAVVTTEFVELRDELFSRPLYSPDLAQNDLVLFPNLKKIPCRKRFQIPEFCRFSKRLLYDWFEKKMETRWAKCVDLQGAYVKNKTYFYREITIYWKVTLPSNLPRTYIV